MIYLTLKYFAFVFEGIVDRAYHAMVYILVIVVDSILIWEILTLKILEFEAHSSTYMYLCRSSCTKIILILILQTI